MPITYVLKISVPADQSIQQYKETLEKRLVALKPRRLNKFHVQTIVYQANNQTSINQFLHSDYTSTCFSLIEPPSATTINSHDIKVLTGDIGLASIQRRIAELGILAERKQLQIECVGSAYKIGDFQVSLKLIVESKSDKSASKLNLTFFYFYDIIIIFYEHRAIRSCRFQIWKQILKFFELWNAPNIGPF
jgi:hypothetical protein